MFGNSWDNLYINFVTLVIKFRFTCETLQMFQNIMNRIIRGFQSVSYLCFVLRYFNIIRSRSQLLCKIDVLKDFAHFTPKSLCWSQFIESPAQVIFPNFWEFSQNSLLQNKCQQLFLVAEWCNGKTWSRNQ